MPEETQNMNFRGVLNTLVKFWEECKSLSNIIEKVKIAIGPDIPKRDIPRIQWDRIISSVSLNAVNQIFQIPFDGVMLLRSFPTTTDTTAEIQVEPCTSTGTLPRGAISNALFIVHGHCSMCISVSKGEYYKVFKKTAANGAVYFYPYKNVTEG